MYYIVNIFTIIFDIIVTYMFFESFLQWKSENIYRKIGVGLFIFILTYINNLFIHDMEFTILISIAVLFFSACIGFTGRYSKKIWVVLGYMAIVIIADIITSLINMFFLNYDGNTLLNVDSNARLLGMIVSKPIVLILVKAVQLFIDKDARIYKGCNIALLTIPIVNVALLIAIVHFFDDINLNDVKYVYIAAMCILYDTILVFYLFNKIMGMAVLKNKYDILEKQIVIQAEQVHQNTDEKKYIKSVKHDLKIHLQTIYQMLKEKHYDAAIQYLKNTKLVNDISEYSIHTGNIALDAIINSKIQDADEKAINITIKCTIPADLKMLDIDMCILFGNLLDNAIEACERITERKRSIFVYLKFRGNRLLCYIKNTAVNDFKIDGDNIVSSKEDKGEHGIGLYNIKSIVKKYDGIIKMQYEDGYFVTFITLYV